MRWEFWLRFHMAASWATKRHFSKTRHLACALWWTSWTTVICIKRLLCQILIVLIELESTTTNFSRIPGKTCSKNRASNSAISGSIYSKSTENPPKIPKGVKIRLQSQIALLRWRIRPWQCPNKVGEDRFQPMGMVSDLYAKICLLSKTSDFDFSGGFRSAVFQWVVAVLSQSIQREKRIFWVNVSL